MKIPAPPLSPSEIVSIAHDPVIGSNKFAAQCTAERITAYGDHRAADAATKALGRAASAARVALGYIRRPADRAAAEKIVRAVEKLLPDNYDKKEAYQRGYADGWGERERKYRGETPKVR